MKKFSLFILFFSLCTLINAQETATFTNGGGDGKWDNPQNWDTGQVPGSNTDAVIPSDYTVTGPESDFTVVKSISNSGVLSFSDVSNSYHIHADQITNTGTLNLNKGANITSKKVYNSGTMNVDDANIKGNHNTGQLCEITNSGNIFGENGGLDISYVSTFSNTGAVIVSHFNANNTNIFLNQENGEIDSENGINISSGFFRNMGALIAIYGIDIISNYAYNNGSIQNALGEINIMALKDYLRKGGKSLIRAINGIVNLMGKKGDLGGSAAAGTSKKKQTILNENAGLLEIAIDTNWIVGDSVKLEGNTIRFIFNYLEFIVIDSIKDIYADSKIEFFGTAGSVLNLEYNYEENIFWVEDGSIEIHSDNIIPPGQGLNSLFHPDPLTGPSDTTFINTYIGSKSISDSTGSSGEFIIYIKNNSTGHRTFNYEISSALDWANTVTGTTQLLASFQYDSLLVDYSIPFHNETLVDTVMIILSVPGEYADTAFSYIRSYPGLTVGFEELYGVGLELNVSPNPFSDKLSITPTKDAIISITDVYGRIVHKAIVESDCRYDWVPEPGISGGVYIIDLKSGNESVSGKVLYKGR